MAASVQISRRVFINNLTIMKSKYRGAIYAIAILLLVTAIAQMGFWIYITTQHEIFLEAKATYLDAFPASMRIATLLTVTDILFLGISLFIFVQSIHVSYRKKLSTVFAIVSAFLALWNLFSLM